VCSSGCAAQGCGHGGGSKEGEADESEAEEAVEGEASRPPENATNFRRNAIGVLAVTADLPNHHPASFIS
jgi:hypothetical protein